MIRKNAMKKLFRIPTKEIIALTIALLGVAVAMFNHLTSDYKSMEVINKLTFISSCDKAQNYNEWLSTQFNKLALNYTSIVITEEKQCILSVIALENSVSKDHFSNHIKHTDFELIIQELQSNGVYLSESQTTMKQPSLVELLDN